MDQMTAAAALGVAAYTVTSVEADGDWWVVTVRDMATHADTVRYLPREAETSVEATDNEVFADVLVADPVAVSETGPEPVVTEKSGAVKPVKKTQARKPKA